MYIGFGVECWPRSCVRISQVDRQLGTCQRPCRKPIFPNECFTETQYLPMISRICLLFRDLSVDVLKPATPTAYVFDYVRRYRTTTQRCICVMSTAEPPCRGYATRLRLFKRSFWVFFDRSPWLVRCSFESVSVDQVQAAFGSQALSMSRPPFSCQCT